MNGAARIPAARFGANTVEPEEMNPTLTVDPGGGTSPPCQSSINAVVPDGSEVEKIRPGAPDESDESVACSTCAPLCSTVSVVPWTFNSQVSPSVQASVAVARWLYVSATNLNRPTLPVALRSTATQ